ncbi:hypothetical protein HMPREF9371_0106 [Neisseria shayeganii 871]|uniref:Uncharacterized protein n=1 Tax=Neisseria shayeganii 871 TaxID=1032488 RepID=G4CER7_9NEIS|nr:hypothetical protein HMPREF9371_0106 [Neisseria shayeganii 871]
MGVLQRSQAVCGHINDCNQTGYLKMFQVACLIGRFRRGSIVEV